MSTIEKPIGIGQLQKHFGCRLGDIGAFIRKIKPRVNKFSRIKPVVSSEEYIKSFGAYSGMGYWGLNICKMTDVPSIMKAVEETQTIEPESGVGLNGYIYPDKVMYRKDKIYHKQGFRYGDFVGYNGDVKSWVKMSVNSNVGIKSYTAKGEPVYDFNAYMSDIWLSVTVTFSDYMPYKDWFNNEDGWCLCLDFELNGTHKYYAAPITSNSTTIKFVGSAAQEDKAHNIYSLIVTENDVRNYHVYPAFAKVRSVAADNVVPTVVMLSPEFKRSDVFRLEVKKASDEYLRASFDGYAAPAKVVGTKITSVSFKNVFDTAHKITTTRNDILVKLTITNATTTDGKNITLDTTSNLFFQATLTTQSSNGFFTASRVVQGRVCNPNDILSTNFRVTIPPSVRGQSPNRQEVYVWFNELVPDRNVGYNNPTIGVELVIKASGSTTDDAYQGDSQGLNIEARSFRIVTSSWANDFSGETITLT